MIRKRAEAALAARWVFVSALSVFSFLGADAAAAASHSKVHAARTARAEPARSAPARLAAKSSVRVILRSSHAGKSPIRRAAAEPASGAVRAAATLRANSRRNGRLVKVSAAPAFEAPPSIGQAIGLHAVEDPLDLRSAVALVVDQQTNEVLYQKNPGAVLPIASISKLMTAMVVLDANLPPHEMIEVTDDDVDTLRFSSSRLRVGSRLERVEMLKAALMASENRAAHSLARYYPGGLPAFIAAMNRKAASLGMSDTHFDDPTGLSSTNVSTARDLAIMVKAASNYPLIREFSTATGFTVDNGFRNISFHNTNRLVDSPKWDIGLQKTGFINEAGNCLVMQTRLDGHPVIMVLLDGIGRGSRIIDAQRLRRWLEAGPIRASVQPAGGASSRPLVAVGS